jgi:hypothetical protein
VPVVYAAVKRFGPACGEPWRKFVEWSGLTQLREVVSLDGALCLNVVRDLTDEDWRHNVQGDYKVTLFHDLDYLVGRAAGEEQVNILALLQHPAEDEVHSFGDRRFVFRGFDLVELQTGISALVNCGGFDKAFARADLSEWGLLTDHAGASRAQRLLREEYPDEPHAACDVWAVWQMTATSEISGDAP